MINYQSVYNTPVLKKNQPDDSYKIQPLPPPVGSYPYHLPLSDIIEQPDQEKMVFHMLGDTGGSGRPEARAEIVAEICGQYKPNGFIYHLGDVVYHFGEAHEYAGQFFEPFEPFPGPIFAIAGNHDSDVNPESAVAYRSLDAFTAVFCDTKQQKIAFAGDSKRTSMVQPNVYWTLETPLATIIGLHTNVPKFGAVNTVQLEWFRNELANALKDKLLIVCLHHAPYSADINHGSSLDMINMLNNAYAAAGVYPDIVFSGHVHNYQRFHKSCDNGKLVPYIVSGAGGFDELHKLARTDDERFSALPFTDVTLQKYQENRHGFLRIEIERRQQQLLLNGYYYTVSNNGATLTDEFEVTKSM